MWYIMEIFEKQLADSLPMEREELWGWQRWYPGFCD